MRTDSPKPSTARMTGILLLVSSLPGLALGAAPEARIDWPSSAAAGLVFALMLLATTVAWHSAKLRRGVFEQIRQIRVERSQLQEQLLRSERLVEETQRLGQVGTWEWDIENNRLAW